MGNESFLRQLERTYGIKNTSAKKSNPVPPGVLLNRQIRGEDLGAQPVVDPKEAKETIRRRMIATIRHPMTALIKSFSEVASGKKYPQIKVGFNISDLGTSVLGISNFEVVVVSDATEFDHLIDTKRRFGILCSEWSTELNQACIIAQLMSLSGVWDEYWSHLKEHTAVESESLLLFQSNFQVLDKLMRDQKAALSDRFVYYLEMMQ